MAIKQFSNNATTTLAAAISSTATSLSVVSGGGALFPTISGSQTFTATLVSASNSTIHEIVLVTASPSADNFTITRAQEGTTALAWSAGDYFSLLNTAGDMSAFQQADDVQAQSGSYALDTGSANAYSANFTPPITTHIVGAALRVKIANANTGASTFNDGAGAASLYLPGGGALSAGQLIAGGIAVIAWDGAGFQLLNSPTSISGLEQTVIDLIYPIGAYVLWENDVVTPDVQFSWQTWIEVQGYVLVGRNPAVTQFASTGQTGGEVSHVLATNECPPLPFQDCYYAEGSSSSGGPTNGNPQPGDQWLSLGSLNHAVGSASTDYDNLGSYYRNAATLNGVAGPGGSTVAAAHNNLQPYRVVRMWRRTA